MPQSLVMNEEHRALLADLAGTEDLNDCIDVICKATGVAFVTYHLAFNEGTRIDQPYVKTNYPGEWVREYLCNNYVEIDPVAQVGFKLSLPCYWSDLDWSDPRVAPFLARAEQFGVGGSGYLVPVSDHQRRRAIVNFASNVPNDEWQALVEPLKSVFSECAQILHHKACVELYGPPLRKPKLSPREIQCLTWVAQGKDALSIGIILGISEHTVRDYCKSAKHKLGCTTLFEAIHRATIMRLLNLEAA